MSQQQNQPQQGQGQSDFVADLIWTLVKVLLGVVFLVPFLVAFLAYQFFGMGLATKWRYWTTPRWWPWAVAGGLVVWAGLLTWEVVSIVQWVQEGSLTTARDTGDIDAVVGFVVPWLILNLVAGVLLVPATFSIRRRRMRTQTRLRRLPDVARQEQVELAMQRAGDYMTAQSIGVVLDVGRGEVVRVREGAKRAPLHVDDNRHAFGVRRRDPIRNVVEGFHDERSIGGWMSKNRRTMTLPDKPGATRALLIAESGSGKTELFNSWMGCGVASGWRQIFIDGKGDPADSARTIDGIRALGGTAAVAGKWNMFSGTAEQIVGKVMRLYPSSGGDGDYYRSNAERALRLVQEKEPVRSYEDLRARLLERPADWVSERSDLTWLNERAGRDRPPMREEVWQAFALKLAPLRHLIAEDGWTFEDTGVDVLVVPLSPVDPAQKQLGDLMLFALRNYLTDRLQQGDRSPVLTHIDEFAQLVGDDVDAGDSATSLYETCRSAGMGLIIGAQSVAGLSQDEVTRARLLSSGAALIVGRSKDPEGVAMLAGTVTRLEASGTTEGAGLNSGRSQHTWTLPPGHIRDANIGAFWMVQAGAVVPFRALLPAAGLPPAIEDEAADEPGADAAPVLEQNSQDEAAAPPEAVQPATGAQAAPARPGEPA